MNYILHFLVFSFGIIVAFFIYHYSFPPIHFLTKEETLELLQDDNDKYYSTFTDKDLKSRNCDSVDEYKKKIKNSVIDFNEILKDKIRYCVYKITSYLSTIKDKEIHNINIEKYLNLKWKISLTFGYDYEYGLPHTRHDVILLNKENCELYSPLELCKTLLHEKVHVYQKMIPDFKEYLEKNFEKTKRNNNTRANPDTDGIVYKNIHNGVTLTCEYGKDSLDVNKVKCTNSDVSMEHPYEMIAYEFDKLSNNIIKK